MVALKPLPDDWPAPKGRRPRTRGECADGPRPCQWINCRHHLAIESRWPSRLTESCALDLADRDGLTLAEIGDALGYTRERIRQIQKRALAKLGDQLWRLGILDARP